MPCEARRPVFRQANFQRLSERDIDDLPVIRFADDRHRYDPLFGVAIPDNRRIRKDKRE